MHSAHEFLIALTAVLGVAAVTTLVFQWLHQPVVLGYLLAGLIVGPHVPIPLVARPEIVQSLAEMGIILLMFGLGLEFSLSKLLRAAPTAGVTALIQSSFMIWIGYVTGRALGWTALESIFTGALIAISSTTIIAKAFDEQGIRGRLREFVVSVLIVEDLIAVVLIALLTALASGRGLSASDLGITIARLTGFLVALVALGLLVVPRLMRAIVRLGRPETTVIVALAVCVGIALLAQELGYSVALGAFVAGVLVAESGEVRHIEPLVHPVRDVFAAVFFVAVGMQMDPATIFNDWFAVVVLTAVLVTGKIVSVAIGAFLTGQGPRTSIAAGMSLAQIGEFSFIIAGLGITLGAIRPQLYPIAVAVSALTTLTTPWLIGASGRAGAFVDRTLPRPVQTFAALYENWIGRLRQARRESRTQVRRFLPTLMLDVTVVAGILIGFSLSFDWLVSVLRTVWDQPTVARVIVVVLGGLLALPFCVGILRTTGRLATTLAAVAVPPSSAGVDLGRAPRTVVAAAVQLGGVLIAGLPLVALTQPFLHGHTAAAVLLIALIVLAIIFWRTTTDLHGHVRAVTHAIVKRLAAQSATPPAGGPIASIDELLPGLGIVRVEVPLDGWADGKSLGELEVRGSTGASVLAIVRGAEGIVNPKAHEPLHGGDILGLVGSHEATEAATALLTRVRGDRAADAARARS